MATVPHSGNKCSGLCVTPCDHADCWQCGEAKIKAEKKEAEKKGVAKALRPPTVMPSPVFASFSPPEATMISRAALEDLASRAGLKLEWNHGDPVLFSPGANGWAGVPLDHGLPQEGSSKVQERASDADRAAVEKMLGKAPQGSDPLLRIAEDIAALRDAKSREAAINAKSREAAIEAALHRLGGAINKSREAAIEAAINAKLKEAKSKVE